MAPSVFAQCGAQHLVGIQQALVGGQVGSVPQIFLKSYVVGSVWGTTVAGTQTGMVLALVGDLTETFGSRWAILDGAQEKGQAWKRRHICGH